MHSRSVFLMILVLSLFMSPSIEGTGPSANAENLLPPVLPWDGASRSLALAPKSDDPWITPSERLSLEGTPSYAETMAWLQDLVRAAPELEMVSLGKSGEGRDVWMVIASAGGVFTPAALKRSGRPTVLVQAGIHAGEIDGKDAGLMLLRDLTVGGMQRALLDGANLLFIPIFNVDGHERISEYGRINQRGPEHMGWRTNARNLNLNRDYAKADTPEMQSLLKALATWDPDLYIDIHVTDGIDYQYDITWGYGGEQGYSPSISRWFSGVLDPPVVRELERQGHIPGYLVFAGGEDPDRGLFLWSASSPRFSDGYGASRHLPTILVENHSLKPYRQRVLGTYVFLASVLETVGKNRDSLMLATAEDRSRRPSPIALSWKVPESPTIEMIDFKGVEWRAEDSAISGGKKVVWLGTPVAKTLPRVAPTAVDLVVERPVAYWVPGAWCDVIERLALHGIEMETLSRTLEVEVEMYRLHEATLANQPFEGRVMVDPGVTPRVERRREIYPPGSVRVPLDQPLGDLAAQLLEPQAADSFFRWGFFLEIMSRTEYVEGYVIDPMAERMLAADPDLKAAFLRRLAEDAEFAADAGARRRWFYERTPFFDERWLLYPVGREVAVTEH